MPCFRPIPAWQDYDKQVTLWNPPKAKSQVAREFEIPCGRCEGCLMERARMWAMRCVHEARQWENNCFITLTYRDEMLPSYRSLNHSHFQRFMKVLRSNHKGCEEYVDPRTGKVSNPIRYFMAGEYGKNLGRPHYHALLFNFDFKDRQYHGKTRAGSEIFRSADLEYLWAEGKESNRVSLGFSSVGDVTFESAAYVARYVLKKAGGQFDSDFVDIDGTVYEDVRIPEYCRMSLRPGIGATWFDAYKEDVYPSDEVLVNGFPSKPPRYYDKLLKKYDPDLYEVVELDRSLGGQKSWRRKEKWSKQPQPDLGARQKVLQAKLEKLQRTF
jgi:hypothetical protein